MVLDGPDSHAVGAAANRNPVPILYVALLSLVGASFMTSIRDRRPLLTEETSTALETSRQLQRQLKAGVFGVGSTRTPKDHMNLRIQGYVVVRPGRSAILEIIICRILALWAPINSSGILCRVQHGFGSWLKARDMGSPWCRTGI